MTYTNRKEQNREVPTVNKNNFKNSEDVNYLKSCLFYGNVFQA